MNREFNIERFLPLAKKIAWEVWQRGRSLDLADLEGQAGLILVKAMDSHDPSRGELAPHVAFRLRHDLLDYVRVLSPLTRNHHTAIKAGKAVPVAHISLSLSPDDAEERALSPMANEIPVAEVLASDQIDSLRRSVKFTLQELKVFRRMRAGKDFPQIVREMRVSEGRISQLCRAVVEKLRAAEANPLPRYCLWCERKLQRITRLQKQRWFCSRVCSDLHKRLFKDPNLLSDLYERKQLSIAKIARRLKCERNTVWYALKRLRIECRPAKAIARTKCVDCGRGPVYKAGRCKPHFTLRNNELARERRAADPRPQSERVRRGWITRKQGIAA